EHAVLAGDWILHAGDAPDIGALKLAIIEPETIERQRDFDIDLIVGAGADIARRVEYARRTGDRHEIFEIVDAFVHESGDDSALVPEVLLERNFVLRVLVGREVGIAGDD